jgi:hypothetical protein
LAGSLQQADLSKALALGADIVGVRTAACEGGQRSGSISTRLVECLKNRVSGVGQPISSASHSASSHTFPPSSCAPATP